MKKNVSPDDIMKYSIPTPRDIGPLTLTQGYRPIDFNTGMGYRPIDFNTGIYTH